MATKSSTSPDRSDTDTDGQELSGGFSFPTHSAVEGHKIEASYDRRYTDTIVIKEGEVRTREDTDGCFGLDDRVECECGETFQSRDEAKDHLEQLIDQFIDFPPYPELPPTPALQEEETSVFDDRVSGKRSVCNTVMIVDDGHDFLAATSRETFCPPEQYDFENWEPLTEGGRLRANKDTKDGGRPLFLPRTVRKAMALATGGRHTYDPERFTIYFRGDKPMYIEGAGRGVVVAPTEAADG